MFGTKATPADFKRLVKKIRNDVEFEERKTFTCGRYYKSVYVYFLKDTHKVCARLEFLGGDVEMSVFQRDGLTYRAEPWTGDEIADLAWALRDMATIHDAFYSVDQSTVRPGKGIWTGKQVR